MSNKVLIIEDDVRSRKLARDIVNSIGLTVLEVDTAEDGIRLAMSESPALALILLDLCLPAMNGDEALKIFREDERTSKLPVVCIIASVLSEDGKNLTQLGFDRIVVKPYHFHDLTTINKEIMGEEE